MTGRFRPGLLLGFFLGGAAFCSSAFAGEQISYTYDARGRLVAVSRSGTVNNGVQAAYAYDKADNRTNVTVTGSSMPDFTISDASATEGSALVFTVTRGGTTSASQNVSYATSNGTATAGSDYTTKSGTLTFAIGQTSQTISVATIDDAASEASETVNVTLSGATGGATISDALGVGTIIDNDAPPPCGGISYTVNDASVVEGAPLVFTVTKSGTTSSSCTINYATANGTAIAGTHYAATSGTLTFTSAQSSKTVTVTTYDTGRRNGIKSLYLNLSSASGGASITDSQGVGGLQASNSGGDPCPLCRTSGSSTDTTTDPPPQTGG